MNLFLQDVCGVIKRVLSFLGRQLSEDALKRVIEQCAFKNMKQNNMSNYSLVPQEHLDQSKVSFLRKGRQKKKHILIGLGRYTAWPERKRLHTKILESPLALI